MTSIMTPPATRLHSSSVFLVGLLDLTDRLRRLDLRIERAASENAATACVPLDAHGLAP